jgi:Lipase (class 3)
MIITQQPTIRAGAIPRVWKPVETPKRPLREELDDAVLLKLTSLCCASTYKRWKNPAVMLADPELGTATDRIYFRREEGEDFWRFLALSLLPLNYLLIALWAVVLLIPLIVAVFLLEALLEAKLGYPYHFALWIIATSPTWLWWLGAVALGLGLLVGAFIAFAPGCASGRAFGLVDADKKRAIVVFCGSVFFDNLAINALVFPCYFPFYVPLSHLGFNRAWDHIKPQVVAWLKKAVDEGRVKEIVFTGHSLGGAMAQIAARDLSGEFPVSHVLSFGSACIGGRGMLERFKHAAAVGGQLNDKTRHFTYSGDVMPRIPPIMIFSHVGKRFRLWNSGRLEEGTEGGLIKSYGVFILNKMAALESVLVSMARKLKRRISGSKSREEPDWFIDGKRVIPLNSPDNPFNSAGSSLGSMADRQARITRAVERLTKAMWMFPGAVVPLLGAVVFVLLALPIITLVTISVYYVVAFWKGLKHQHGAANYRDAFKSYTTVLERAASNSESPSLEHQ